MHRVVHRTTGVMIIPPSVGSKRCRFPCAPTPASELTRLRDYLFVFHVGFTFPLFTGHGVPPLNTPDGTEGRRTLRHVCFPRSRAWSKWSNKPSSGLSFLVQACRLESASQSPSALEYLPASFRCFLLRTTRPPCENKQTETLISSKMYTNLFFFCIKQRDTNKDLSENSLRFHIERQFYE